MLKQQQRPRLSDDGQVSCRAREERSSSTLALAQASELISIFTSSAHSNTCSDVF